MTPRRLRNPVGNVAFLGHFGKGNFGNEGTLQAMLQNIRCRMPRAVSLCICTGPAEVAADYDLTAVPLSGAVGRSKKPRNAAGRFLHKILVGIPLELRRWIAALRALSEVDVVIVPGTGLLTDAYSLFGWGPYNIFKWSVAARLQRCKLLFVSVGVGPVYSGLGKFLIRSALSLADFRSYRDEPSREWACKTGVRADTDPVVPDLVFSYPEEFLASRDLSRRNRRVVGLGVMQDAGRYSVQGTEETYRSYLDNLAAFARWLLDNDWDIRLLIGDVVDIPVIQKLQTLLRESGAYDEERVNYQTPTSVQHLIQQLAATDLVVATRFHNVLMAFLLNKPTIAISFHHKCSSLMSQMGMSDYCQEISRLKSEELQEKFLQLEGDIEIVKNTVRQHVEERRFLLNEHYLTISTVMQGK